MMTFTFEVEEEQDEGILERLSQYAAEEFRIISNTNRAADIHSWTHEATSEAEGVTVYRGVLMAPYAATGARASNALAEVYAYVYKPE